jgi:hypothetical protein
LIHGWLAAPKDVPWAFAPIVFGEGRSDAVREYRAWQISITSDIGPTVDLVITLRVAAALEGNLGQ